METFLPYPNFEDSVNTYDLFTTQLVRRSILSLLEILHETDSAMVTSLDHPEIRKWKGHEAHLSTFGLLVNEEYPKKVDEHPTLSGFQPYSTDYARRMEWHLDCAADGDTAMTLPDWWGEADYHHAEKSALLRRNYQHYSNFFEGVPVNLPPSWMRLPWHG